MWSASICVMAQTHSIEIHTFIKKRNTLYLYRSYTRKWIRDIRTMWVENSTGRSWYLTIVLDSNHACEEIVAGYACERCCLKRYLCLRATRFNSLIDSEKMYNVNVLPGATAVRTWCRTDDIVCMGIYSCDEKTIYFAIERWYSLHGDFFFKIYSLESSSIDIKLVYMGI